MTDQSGWLVSIPAWGDRCVGLARSIVIPSLIAAARLATRPVRFVVHTDRYDDLRDCFGDFPCAISPLPEAVRWLTNSPSGPGHMMALCAVHREVIQTAPAGDYVAPMVADCVVSRELFCASERQFSRGKRLILCVPPRTIGAPPGPGADGAAIIDFASSNLHPVSIDAIWGQLGIFQPSLIYQQNSDNLACNAFNLHPVAVAIREQPIEYEHTVDYDMPMAFGEAECHLVTDPNEMAIAEMSPPDMRYRLALEMGQPDATPAWIAEWAMRNTVPRHRWFFRHRLMLRGVDQFENDPVPEIVRLMA